MTASSTSRLKACEARLAEAESLQARVREYWIPVPGHPIGDLHGVSVHTLDGTNWAIRHESILGMRAWTCDGWTAPMFVITRERAYCWGDRDTALAEAEQVAEMLARQEAPTVGEFADQVQGTVEAVREAVAS